MTEEKNVVTTLIRSSSPILLLFFFYLVLEFCFFLTQCKSIRALKRPKGDDFTPFLSVYSEKLLILENSYVYVVDSL